MRRLGRRQGCPPGAIVALSGAAIRQRQRAVQLQHLLLSSNAG